MPSGCRLPVPSVPLETTPGDCSESPPESRKPEGRPWSHVIVVVFPCEWSQDGPPAGAQLCLLGEGPWCHWPLRKGTLDKRYY